MIVYIFRQSFISVLEILGSTFIDNDNLPVFRKTSPYQRANMNIGFRKRISNKNKLFSITYKI